MKKTLSLVLVTCTLIAACAESPTSKETQDENVTSSSVWEKDVYEYEEEDMAWGTPKGVTLFIGSSSMRLWREGLDKAFAPHSVLTRGFGGAKTDDVLYYFDRLVLPYEPKNIVYYAGGNDLWDSGKDSKSHANFVSFVDRVKEDLPDTHVYVLSSKPSPLRFEQWPLIEKLNLTRKEYADMEDNVTYIDVSAVLFKEEGDLNEALFAADRLHLNAEGYASWAKILREKIEWEE